MNLGAKGFIQHNGTNCRTGLACPPKSFKRCRVVCPVLVSRFLDVFMCLLFLFSLATAAFIYSRTTAVEQEAGRMDRNE